MYKRVQDLKTEITCPREKNQKDQGPQSRSLPLPSPPPSPLPSLDMCQTESERMCSIEAPNLSIYTGWV